jgi:hypothetical protein
MRRFKGLKRKVAISLGPLAAGLDRERPKWLVAVTYYWHRSRPFRLAPDITPLERQVSDS